MNVARLNALVNHSAFTGTVVGLILINAVIVGLETYPGVQLPYGDVFHWLDSLLLWAFSVEIALRFLAVRPWYNFFKDGWNVFDFVIVASGHFLAGAHFVSVLRMLRVLRVLRAVSVIPSLQRLVSALLATIPAMGNIMILMGLLFYVFGVVGTSLFRQAAPQHFGSLHDTLLTLFQVVTLESWASQIARPLIQEISWAWIYFVAFIVMGTFVIFNLFVGVIVNNVQRAATDESDEMERTEVARLSDEIASLREVVLRLEKANRPGS